MSKKQSKQNKTLGTAKATPVQSATVEDKKPDTAKPEVKEAPKPKKAPVPEAVVIDTKHLPDSNASVQNSTVSDLNKHVDNLLRVYKENPAEGLDPNLIDMYVGKNGLVHMFLAETTVRLLRSGNNVVLQNLPSGTLDKIMHNMELLGANIKDPKQLELQFKEEPKTVTIKATDVEIDDDLGTQIDNDIKDEKEAVAPVKDDTKTLKHTLIRTMLDARKENKPFVGFAKCIETMQLEETLAAGNDVAAKETISNRTMSQKLEHLFEIVPFSTMFIAIGRALIESLQVSDPITMFFTLKKAMTTTENGKEVVPFTDEEIASIARTLVNTAIDFSNLQVNDRIATLEKKETLTDPEARALKRYKDSVSRNLEAVNNMCNYGKDSISAIKDNSALLKSVPKPEDSDYNEKKPLYVNSQLYFNIAKELGLDPKLSENDVMTAVHNRAVAIANYFRGVDEQLTPTGRLDVVETTTEVKTPTEESKPTETPAPKK